MSNLTPSQLSAIAGGSSIAQTWNILCPIAAGGSPTSITHVHTLPGSEPSRYRVVRAGTRKHEVWNPHVNADINATSLRYSFEVDNSDGFFHLKSGGAFNTAGLYAADPTECLVEHKTYVMSLVTKQHEEIESMSFTGNIISVEYVGSAKTSGTISPATAVITCEQAGAWDALKRPFIKEDGDFDPFTNNAGTSFWSIAP